jgi:hypothetical protein
MSTMGAVRGGLAVEMASVREGVMEAVKVASQKS